MADNDVLVDGRTAFQIVLDHETEMARVTSPSERLRVRKETAAIIDRIRAETWEEAAKVAEGLPCCASGERYSAIREVAAALRSKKGQAHG
jgi:hypothetical protein